jgi:hypothetical protein
MSAATTSAGPPYVSLVPYPTGLPVTGGDSLNEDLNIYYEVSDSLDQFMEPEELTRMEDRQHRMDAHVHRIGLAHDSWRWVRSNPSPNYNYNL